MAKYYITELDIDNSTLDKRGETRSLKVWGTPGAIFSLTITNDDPKYYNFKTKSFQTAITKAVHVKMPSTGFMEETVVFPSVSSNDQYDIELLTDPHFETELKWINDDRNLGEFPKQIVRKIIYQYVDTTITLGLKTRTSGEFSTFPSDVEIVKLRGKDVKGVTEITWTITAVASISASALKITRQPVQSDWEVSKNVTVNGAHSSVTDIVVDSVDGLIVGMYLDKIDSTWETSSIATIKSINENTNTITLTGAKSADDDEVLIFTIGGEREIENFSGALIKFKDLSLKTEAFTGTVNQPTWDGTQTATNDIILDNVTGIRADGTVKVEGIGIATDKTGIQYVTAIAYGSSSITITNNQQLKDNTILYFDGTSQEAKFRATITLDRMPSSDLAIDLDVDNILTSATT